MLSRSKYEHLLISVKEVINLSNQQIKRKSGNKISIHINIHDIIAVRHVQFASCCQAEFSKVRNHHTTTVSRPFFREHPGEPVPEENFWTLWCKED